MIVTLNVVHPDRIRSVDREEFDKIQRKTRSQTSISSNIDSFGLNIQRDLVRSVAGQPEDTTFAAHVTGADNLIMRVIPDASGERCWGLRHEDRHPAVFKRLQEIPDLPSALDADEYRLEFITVSLDLSKALGHALHHLVLRESAEDRVLEPRANTRTDPGPRHNAGNKRNYN